VCFSVYLACVVYAYFMSEMLLKSRQTTSTAFCVKNSAQGVVRKILYFYTIEFALLKNLEQQNRRDMSVMKNWSTIEKNNFNARIHVSHGIIFRMKNALVIFPWVLPRDVQRRQPWIQFVLKNWSCGNDNK